MDAFAMDGERVLVTGASSGLGAGFARRLARSGAAVALAARRLDALSALAAEIEAAGGRAAAVRMDVSDPASVIDGVAEAEAALGGLTGLVNNAGVAAGAAALDTDADTWTRTMRVNVDGAFWTAQAVARGMAARRAAGGSGGAIVNIASILGRRVSAGVAAYAVSKAAVEQMTRALALEWAKHDIRVNALAPGYFPTDINAGFLASEGGEAMRQRIPMRRFGAEGELDGPLLLLLSKAGAYMTGETLAVDGGHLVSGL